MSGQFILDVNAITGIVSANVWRRSVAIDVLHPVAVDERGRP